MNAAEKRPYRILISEDVEENVLLMTAFLSGDDYQVSVARDGQECLDMVPDFKPELIILDLMMPKVHGLEVLMRLKANPETRGIGVIICSAKDFKTEVEQAYEWGILTEVAEDAEALDAMVASYAKKLNAQSPLALRTAKRVVNT